MRRRNLRSLMHFVERYRTADGAGVRQRRKAELEKALENAFLAPPIQLVGDGFTPLREKAVEIFVSARRAGEAKDEARMPFVMGALWALQWARDEVKRKAALPEETSK